MNASRRGKKVALLLAVILFVGAVIIGFTSGPEIAAYANFHLAFESLGVNPQGRPEYRHRQTGIVFVEVPGGTFVMGSPEDEGGHEPDEKRHQVTLSPFLIAKYEVTQAQWCTVLGSAPSTYQTKADALPAETFGGDVLGKFCYKTGLQPPTEAQWEYACRAGTAGAFAGTGRLEDMGWFQGNSGGHPHPVGRKLPNAWGLYDMHGNVLELCLGSFDQQSMSAANDPPTSVGHERRYVVLRGGGFLAKPVGCRSAYRWRWTGGFSMLARIPVGLRPVAPSPP